MKKKIKDLTLNECRYICFGKRCSQCPLYYGDGLCRLFELNNIRQRETTNFDLEREVEIDEQNDFR